VTPPADAAGSCGQASLLDEHSPKPVVVQAPVLSRLEWAHRFGTMVIETCTDGSVWIDGKPVPDTWIVEGTER